MSFSPELLVPGGGSAEATISRSDHWAKDDSQPENEKKNMINIISSPSFFIAEKPRMLRIEQGRELPTSGSGKLP